VLRAEKYLIDLVGDSTFHSYEFCLASYVADVVT
jgi:hypothetical protein